MGKGGECLDPIDPKSMDLEPLCKAQFAENKNKMYDGEQQMEIFRQLKRRKAALKEYENTSYENFCALKIEKKSDNQDLEKKKKKKKKGFKKKKKKKKKKK